MAQMSITRRKALQGISGAVAAAGLGLSRQPAHATTTLRMWTFLDPVNGKTGREVALRKLIDGFQAANPDITILVEPQNSRVMSEKFFAAHQSGTAPDIAWILTSRLNAAIKLGSLANLDELFIKNWSKDNLEDIDSPSFRFGSTPTARYQIPNSQGMQSQLYRVDLFQDAGIDPKSIANWDDFVAAAEKLVTKSASGDVSCWGFGQTNAGLAPPSPILGSILLDIDGRLFDDEMNAVWSTRAGVRGMELQADMIRKYKIMPESQINMNNEQVHEQFLAGRAAISRTTTIRFQRATDQIGVGKVGYLPTPSFTDGKHSPSEVTGWHVGVWSGSQKAELAGKFVEYMIAAKEADVIWSTVAGLVPLRQSTIAANTDFFADPANAILSEVAQDIRRIGWFPPPDAGAGGWNEGLCAAFQDVMANNTDPKAALEKAETAFNRMQRG